MILRRDLGWEDKPQTAQRAHAGAKQCTHFSVALAQAAGAHMRRRPLGRSLSFVFRPGGASWQPARSQLAARSVHTPRAQARRLVQTLTRKKDERGHDHDGANHVAGFGWMEGCGMRMGMSARDRAPADPSREGGHRAQLRPGVTRRLARALPLRLPLTQCS